MPMAPKEPGKNVELHPLSLKSLHARTSLLVRRQAQAGRFGRPPSSGTSYAQRLNVKLRPLCIKSLRARASLLVQWWAQTGGFGKPPHKFWNPICPKVECMDAYGTQRTSQKCEITSIMRKIFTRPCEPAFAVVGTGWKVWKTTSKVVEPHMPKGWVYRCLWRPKNQTKT